MPCENCPETSPSPRRAQIALVIYTGGPSHAQFVALGAAIPPLDTNVRLQYGWPTVRPDGCLEYRGGQKPPVPEGYAATIDPHVLKPVWPSCARRMLKVQMQMDTGLLQIDGVCCNPASGKTGRDLLTLAHCQQCLVRRVIREA
jgi:hypothetical protein